MQLSQDLRNQLFEERDYRLFLKKVLSENAKIRGYKTQLSASAGCQPAYFSQVMVMKAELTPEQSERLCSFWNLNDFESDYFFNLVMLGRSGTVSLRKRMEKKLNEIRKNWKVEKATFGKQSVPESASAMLYYSHWIYSAVHLLLTVPTFQNEKSLAEHLRKTDKEIHRILQRLEKAGLVEKTSDGWRSLQVQLHATEEDFFAEIHHKNWRTQAMEIRGSVFDDVVRYTSVHSLSKEDFIKIQALIEELIEKSRQVIEPSKEEMGACLLIDYFGF